MKGQISVNPIFTPTNISKAQIYHQSPILAIDNRRLHIRNHSMLWDPARSIINCTYSTKYKTFLLLCDDWKLYVYNQNLDQIAKLLNWESKYTVGFQLIQSLDYLLLIGVGQVQILKMNIITNIKKTKFLSSVKFGIQKKQLLSQDPATKLKWNKGYGYDLQDNLLFVWSLQDINFFSLNKLETRSNIRNLVKKQNPITYVYYNKTYKYTVTGLMNGNVTVWRLPLSKILDSQAHQYIMIHNCIFHTKLVNKIIATNDDRVIVSGAADLTICLWSLETFQLLRYYNFEGQYSKIMLRDYHGALAVKQGVLGELTFGKTMQFITQISSNITFHDKTYENSLGLINKKQPKNRVTQFQITYSSNLGMQIQTQSLKQKDLNKIQVQHFYPPLKSQQIKQVISCPFMKNRYYLLTQTGKIFKVRMEGQSSLIQFCYNIQLTHDIQNHPLNQLPTFIKFSLILPTQFDSQIIQSTIIDKTNNLSQAQQAKQHSLVKDQSKFESLKLMTIGCNKGSIVFLPIDNMDHIYTRITYHRQQIIAIQTFSNNHEINSSYLVSMCIQRYMKFVKFSDNKASCISTIYCGQTLRFFKGFQDNLAIVLQKGVFQISKFNKYEEPIVIQNFDAIDHQGQIFCLDYDSQKEVILTAGSDNKIRIWTYLKVLLYQIHLDQGLKYAFFTNEFQIIVSHNMKLLYLRDLPFSVTKQELQQYNSNFLDANNIEHNYVNIKQYFNGLKNPKVFNQAFKQPFQKLQQKKQNPFNLSKQFLRIKQKNQIVQNFKIKSTKIMTQRKKRIVNKSKQKGKGNLTARTSSLHQTKKIIYDEASLISTKKHLQEMDKYKKQVNSPLLPRIQAKTQDIFDQFMRDKIMNKKILTRRDITLNRIIMKNIIKDNIGEDQTFNSLKLDF